MTLFSDNYEPVPVPSDADSLYQEAVDRIQTTFPDWEPNTGNLDTALLVAIAFMNSDTQTTSLDVPDGIFKIIGQNLFNFPPIAAAAATATSTWTAMDNAGYTVQAGTEVTIAESGNVRHGFRVVSTVVIPPGSTSTGAGEVILEAIIEGAQANDLTEDPELIRALDWVDSISLVDPPTNGEDAETDFEYLTRLRQKLRLLAPRPIVPADFETEAITEFRDIDRALALDTFDPAGDDPDDPGTWTSALHVTVAGLEEDGSDLDADTKTALAAHYETIRELNFVPHVIDATRSIIDVEVNVEPLPGVLQADADAAAIASITSWLQPYNWGRPQYGDPGVGGGWRRMDTVRRNDAIAIAKQGAGVDTVTGLQLAIQGNALGTADLSLPGAAPLAVPGNITAV